MNKSFKEYFLNLHLEYNPSYKAKSKTSGFLNILFYIVDWVLNSIGITRKFKLFPTQIIAYAFDPATAKPLIYHFLHRFACYRYPNTLYMLIHAI